MNKKTATNPRGAGRGRIYLVRDFEIGQSMIIPWLWGFDYQKWRPLKADLIHSAIRQEQRRFNKYFLRKRTIAGLKITRLY